MYAHSAAWCQCNSRTPPAVSRIFTPEMVFEIGKSACVTCRAQPPSWMRRGALLNEAQIWGMLPTSVGCGANADGNGSLIAGFCGPGSVTLAGFLALMAPCGGSSGLPKEAAAAAVADIAAPAAAVARTSRLENMAFSFKFVGKTSLMTSLSLFKWRTYSAG